MHEYITLMWKTFGWEGFMTAGSFIFYNLLMIFSLYKLEKKVKILMKDKEESDEEDEEISSYFENGGKSPKVITEISEG